MAPPTRGDVRVRGRETSPSALPPVHEVVLDGGPADGAGRAAAGAGDGARALLAAAAVAVVAVAGVLVARRDDTGPDLSSETGRQHRARATTVTTVPGGARPPEAEQIVIDYVDALGRGDTTRPQPLCSVHGPTELPRGARHPADEFLGDGGGGHRRVVDRHRSNISTVVDRGSPSSSSRARSSGGSASRPSLAFPVVTRSPREAWFVDKWAFDPTVEDQGVDFIRPEPRPTGPPCLARRAGRGADLAEPGTACSRSTARARPRPDHRRPDGPCGELDGPRGRGRRRNLVIVFQSESGKAFYAEACPVSAG